MIIDRRRQYAKEEVGLISIVAKSFVYTAPIRQPCAFQYSHVAHWLVPCVYGLSGFVRSPAACQQSGTARHSSSSVAARARRWYDSLTCNAIMQ